METNFRLCGIPSSNVQYLWESVKYQLHAALEYADDKFTLENIYEYLKEKSMQLWLVVSGHSTIHASIVTQIVEYANKKVMFIVLVGGVKFDEWSHVIETFTAFAQSHDCQTIEGYGRAGWEPKLKQLGFKKVHTVYSLPIKKETRHGGNI